MPLVEMSQNAIDILSRGDLNSIGDALREIDFGAIIEPIAEGAVTFNGHLSVTVGGGPDVVAYVPLRPFGGKLITCAFSHNKVGAINYFPAGSKVQIGSLDSYDAFTAMTTEETAVGGEKVLLPEITETGLIENEDIVAKITIPGGATFSGSVVAVISEV